VGAGGAAEAEGWGGVMCLICGTTEGLTKHHCVPKARRSKGTHTVIVDLCGPCHTGIHAIWDTKTLAAEADTPERLVGLVDKAKEHGRWPPRLGSEKRAAKKERKRKVREWLRSLPRQTFGSGR